MNLDQWLGKTLFVPPIIKFCQVAGTSQHAFANVAWTVACIAVIASEPSGAFSWFLYVGFGLASVYCIIRLATDLHKEVLPNSRFLRLIFFWILSFDVVLWAIGEGSLGYNIIFMGSVLFAEYARTIRDIPPPEVSDRSAEMILQKARK